jgi:hypothetical protein
VHVSGPDLPAMRHPIRHFAQLAPDVLLARSLACI